MTRPRFTFRIQRTTSEAIIWLAGEFDIGGLGGVEGFDEAAALVIADPNLATVRVDCRCVSFVDCAALGALVGLRNQADAAGKTVVLGAPSSSMRRLLKLTDIDIDIDIADGGDRDYRG